MGIFREMVSTGTNQKKGEVKYGISVNRFQLYPTVKKCDFFITVQFPFILYPVIKSAIQTLISVSIVLLSLK